MTGGEIIGAAKAAEAAVSAGQKALSDEPQRKQLRELAETTPTMRAAAETYAQRVLVKQSIMLRLWQPLGRMVGISREYFEADFAADLAAKVSDVPDEELEAPKPSIAVPAMEGLAYSLDEPALKDMYLNLLAGASDRRRSSQAHPSFAQIIKELSADEVPLLDTCLENKRLPIVRIKRVTTIGEHPGWFTLYSHLLNVNNTVTGEPAENSQLPGYVDNWARLGLVGVTYSSYMVDNSHYHWVETRPETLRFRREIVGDGVTVEYDKGILDVTDFGARFAAAVRAAG